MVVMNSEIFKSIISNSSQEFNKIASVLAAQESQSQFTATADDQSQEHQDDALESEIETLVVQLTTLLGQKDSRIETLTAALGTLQDQLFELSFLYKGQELENLESQERISDAIAINEMVFEQNEKILDSNGLREQELISTHKFSLNTKEQRITELISNIKNLQKINSDHQASIHQLSNSYQSTVQQKLDLDQELTSAKEKLHNSDVKLEKFSQQAKTLESQIGEIQNLQSYLQDAESQLDSCKKENWDLSRRMVEISTNFETSQFKSDQLGSLLEKSQLEKEILENTLETKEMELVSATRKSEKIKTRYVEVDNENRLIHIANTEMQERIWEIKALLTDSDNKLTDFQNISSELEELREEVKEADSQRYKAESDVLTNQETIKSLTADLAASCANLDALKSEIETRLTTEQTLLQSVESLKTEIQATITTEKTLRENLESLESEFQATIISEKALREELEALNTIDHQIYKEKKTEIAEDLLANLTQKLEKAKIEAEIMGQVELVLKSEVESLETRMEKLELREEDLRMVIDGKNKELDQK
jgi:chromosome segregation ATPase